MGNDLVTEVKDSENIWTGSRLLEDGFDLKEAFESKSWVAGGLAVAATTADAVSAAMDPLGEAMSAGVAWVIEHLGSLNKWLNELTGDSDAVAAAASTWTNIATKLNSCADDLEAVCTGRLAGQESLAVATFKSLQAGSAEHLRMTGGVAGAISGGLTVASVIVRMVHDLVRDAISDVIGKLLSKATITVITAGLAAPWVVQSVISDVASWVTRLSKDIASTVLSAKNLKNLLDKATTLLDDVAAAFARIPAKASEAVTRRMEALEDLASSLSPQHALAGAPGMTMAQARQAGKASPTVHTPKTPKSTKPTRPNPNEGRWGRRLDETTDTTKHTDGSDSTPPKGEGDGSDPMSGPVVFNPPKNPTEAEIAETREYVAGCNRALDAGALSQTGRVPTTSTTLGTEAKYAAKRERIAHPELYSDGKVAGHVPDSTWMGKPDPHEWQPLSSRVNSSLAGQNNRYPIGYKPTEFILGEGD